MFLDFIARHQACFEAGVSLAAWEHWLGHQKWFLGIRSSVDVARFLSALAVFGLVALIAFDISIFWAIIAQYKKEK